MCGVCKFEAELDLTEPTGKCNCSLCAKSRYWGTRCKPEQFKFTSDAGSQEELMTVYIHKNPGIRRLICKKCGVCPFMTVNIPQTGGEMVSINIACLDDFEPEEWAKLPVRYMDGLKDNWMNEPAETAYM
jgi:hypothetical protein